MNQVTGVADYRLLCPVKGELVHHKDTPNLLLFQINVLRVGTVSRVRALPNHPNLLKVTFIINHTICSFKNKCVFKKSGHYLQGLNILI